MSNYVPPKERRKKNRSAVYRVPQGLLSVPSPETEEPMTNEPATITRSSLKWPLYVLLALAAAAVGTMTAFSGCQTGGGTPAIERIERTVDCLKDRLPIQAIAYLDVVTSCLVGGNYMACLAPLAEKAGRDVIACAVAKAGSEANARASSAGPGELPNQENIRNHAKAYLDADGARVTFE